MSNNITIKEAIIQSSEASKKYVNKRYGDFLLMSKEEGEGHIGNFFEIKNNIAKVNVNGDAYIGNINLLSTGNVSANIYRDVAYYYENNTLYATGTASGNVGIFISPEQGNIAVGNKYNLYFNKLSGTFTGQIKVQLLNSPLDSKSLVDDYTIDFSSSDKLNAFPNGFTIAKECNYIVLTIVSGAVCDFSMGVILTTHIDKETVEFDYGAPEIVTDYEGVINADSSIYVQSFTENIEYIEYVDVCPEFIMIKSPNGTKYKLTVNDDGTILMKK